MTTYIVTIQKTGSVKLHTRMIDAASELDAGDQARALIGGPNKDRYVVLRCMTWDQA